LTKSLCANLSYSVQPAWTPQPGGIISRAELSELQVFLLQPPVFLCPVVQLNQAFYQLTRKTHWMEQSPGGLILKEVSGIFVKLTRKTHRMELSPVGLILKEVSAIFAKHGVKDLQGLYAAVTKSIWCKDTQLSVCLSK
jgi:hypothetical protein